MNPPGMLLLVIKTSEVVATWLLLAAQTAYKGRSWSEYYSLPLAKRAFLAQHIDASCVNSLNSD